MCGGLAVEKHEVMDKHKGNRSRNRIGAEQRKAEEEKRRIGVCVCARARICTVNMKITTVRGGVRSTRGLGPTMTARGPFIYFRIMDKTPTNALFTQHYIILPC